MTTQIAMVDINDNTNDNIEEPPTEEDLVSVVEEENQKVNCPECGKECNS